MARIEPPYLVSILLVLALTLLAAQFSQFRGTTEGLLDPWRIAAHFFYLIPLTNYEWLQPVYWTLAYEFAFYLTIGLLFPWMSAKAQWRSFLTLTVVCSLLIMFFGWPARVMLFIMGFSVFRHIIQRDFVWRNLLMLGACFVIMVQAGAWLEGLIGFVVALILSYHERVPGAPSIVARALAALGLISYSLYLFHVPIGGRVVNLGKRFIDSEIEYLALSMTALLVSMVFSAMIFFAVERPAQRLARRVSWWQERRSSGSARTSL